MLKLKNITKNYVTLDNTVTALKNVSLNFRRSEFVSVLGPSGCGKTTLLNIIGGLDRYTDGDIVINGKSTKDYKDKDWDNYRNHSVGFVFQSYNLIPHQSVLKNVELALTLSGIKRDERRERAKAALEKVGLGDQLNKRPNQMSGGQMQRVAIARAIVNNPDIILADEPTGALDTETSVAVMEILKELSKTKLVIMVTHNPELANAYSTRIINLKDGVVTSDTMAYEGETEIQKQENTKEKKPSMSFWTALSLSLNNLATKKTRTILTSFAGSIGIIGIALILSLSAGFNGYITRVQQETLTSYPLQITKVNIDYTNLISTMLGETERNEVAYPTTQEISTQNAISDMVGQISSSASINDLKSFKTHLDANLDKNLVTAIHYGYDLDLTIYRNQTVSTAVKPETTSFNQVYPVKLPPITDLVSPEMAVVMEGYYSSFGQLLTQQPAWGQIVGDKALVDTQYDYLAGNYPKNANETLLVVDKYNQISDLSLYLLGLLTAEDISYLFNEMLYLNTPSEQIDAIYDKLPVPLQTATVQEEKVKCILKAQGIERTKPTFTFDEILNSSEYEYSVILGGERAIKYDTKTHEGITTNLYRTKTETELQDYLKNNSLKLKISGIVRLKDGITNGAITGGIGYTQDFVDLMITKNASLDVIRDYAQEELNAQIRAGGGDKAQCYVNIYTGEIINENEYIGLNVAPTKEHPNPNYINLSAVNEDDPNSISIYAKSFEDKDKIIAFIDEYNASVDEKKQINYSDLVGLMMSSITTIVNAITYILIAFVSISLVVSSIMIGIITYISVLERTKEIGVLRSIGASKRDIKTVFNAETMIIGFVAGALGILITLILNIPINIIIQSLSGIGGVASLPILGGIILIAISVILTTIAGLIPSSMASKKDPVIALRTE